MHVNKSERKLLPMSRIAPGRNDAAEIDTVVSAKRYGDRRAFDILMEAQYYWSQMDDFRKDRERNKRYTYGDQWDDEVVVDGHHMTESEYIMKQGSVPLKNNIIRIFVIQDNFNGIFFINDFMENQNFVIISVFPSNEVLHDKSFHILLFCCKYTEN